MSKKKNEELDKLAAAEAEAIRKEREEAEAYKSKYAAFYKISSPDGAHVLWLRKPSRLAVGVFLAKVEKNVTDACEVLFDDCVVREISDADYFRNDDEAFLGVVPALQAIVRLKKNLFTAL